MSEIRPDGDPTAARVPGTQNLMANTPTFGVTAMTDKSDEAFVSTKGRTSAVLALGTSQAIDNSEGGVSKTFFPQIMAAFALGNSALGVINSMSMFARMLFGPLWAMAADKWGRKKVLFIVTGVWGLWTVATALAQNYTQLLILYGISVIGTVASEPIVNGLLGELFTKKERGKAFGSIRATSSLLGMALTPLLGQFGDNPNGWRYAMAIMGVLSIISGILILIFVKEPARASGKIAEDPDAGLFKLSDAVKLFKIPTLRLVALMIPLVTSLVLFGFMAKFWAVELGYGVKQSSYLYTVFTAGAMVSAFIGGLLADWFVRKLGHKGRIVLMQIYLVSFALMTYLAFQVQWGKGVYYAVVFVLGLIFSIGFSGCVLPMVSSVCPRQLGATSFAVLFSLIQGCVTALMSIMVGVVADRLGLANTLLYFVTLPYLVNAVFWFLFYRVYEKDVALQAERTHLISLGRF